LEPDLTFRWRYPVKELCLNLEANLTSMGKTDVPTEVVTPTAGKVREICLSGLFFCCFILFVFYVKIQADLISCGATAKDCGATAKDAAGPGRAPWQGFVSVMRV